MRLNLIFFIFFTLLAFGCASENAMEPENDELGVVWGAISAGGECVAPLINQQGLPADNEPLHVDRLLIRLEDLNIGGSPKTRQRAFETADTELEEGGFLMVDQVMADTDFNLRIVGCIDGQPEPIWTGYKPAVRVPEFEKIAPTVFITSENALSCASENIEIGDRFIGSGQPDGNAAFATTIPTVNGDYLVAGGVSSDGSDLSINSSASLYHTQTGTFFPLDNGLTAPRAMASGALLDGSTPKSIIFGGSPTFAPSGKTSHPYISPGEEGGDFAASDFVEALDPETGESTTWTLPPGLDGADQRMPALASVLYVPSTDTLFVAGGYGAADSGEPSLLDANNAFVVREMKHLVGADDGPAKSAAILSLQHPRIGPALLESPDGGVVVFGGNPDGLPENVAEWISSDGVESAPVTLVSATTTPSLAFPASFLISSSDTENSYLVVGGIPAQLDQFPSSAIVSQGYAGIVTITSGTTAPTASVEELDLGDHAQRVFGAPFRLSANQFGLAGGLAAVTKTSDFADSLCVDEVDSQCSRNTISLFTAENGKVAVETVDGVNLGAAVGSAAATLPGGSLLFTAGLHSLEAGSSEDNRRPLIWNPLLASEAKLCPLENCDDDAGNDEDLDGLVNCADPECAGQGSCGARN